MSKKATYILLVIFVLGVLGLYFYNKYNIAPDIDVSKLEIVDEYKNPFTLTSLKGKKVIVCFYASWCPNCLVELKALHKIKNEKLQDITIVALTDEGQEKLLAFKQKTNYPFTFLSLSKPFNFYQIYSIPTTYLLNAKGEVVYDNVGYINWQNESTVNHLKTIME